MAGGVPPSLAFRGEDLQRVLLPVAARPGSGRVLALEIYGDGLIVRAAVPAGEPVRSVAESVFEVVDDVGGAYAFAGSVSGGTPTIHVMAMYVGTPGSGAARLDVRSAVGSARFDLRGPGG